MEFTVFDEAIAKLGESPVFDEVSDSFWWVDCVGKALFRTQRTSGLTETWAMPERPGFVVLKEPGTAAIGMETGIYAFSPNDEALKLLVPFNASGFRFNDAVVDPHGVLWAGTQKVDATVGAGALYQISQTGALQIIEEGFTFPNGLAVDPDLGRLYYSDSHASVQCVWTIPWPMDVEVPERKSLFYDFTPTVGRPDGATIDSDGNYWIAAVDTGDIVIFSPAGSVMDRIRTPFDNITKIAFGGADCDHIFVTSKAGIGVNGGTAIAKLEDGHRGRPPAPWRFEGIL